MELYDCVFATWSPKLGDPTLMGWVTVASYVAASGLACFNFVRQQGRQRIFWFLLSIFLIALAINKQLDLQSALTAAGRCLAQAQDWYSERQAVQIKFILGVMVTSVLASLLLLWIMRKELGQIWMALLGFASLLAFVAIRAAGFHHFDRFIGYEIGNVRMNWIIEVGGIALIAVNAVYLLTVRAKGR